MMAPSHWCAVHTAQSAQFWQSQLIRSLIKGKDESDENVKIIELPLRATTLWISTSSHFTNPLQNVLFHCDGEKWHISFRSMYYQALYRENQNSYKYAGGNVSFVIHTPSIQSRATRMSQRLMGTCLHPLSICSAAHTHSALFSMWPLVVHFTIRLMIHCKHSV